MIEQKGVRGFVKPGDVVLEVICNEFQMPVSDPSFEPSGFA